MILLMTQRYFFSLILSWLVVVSNSEVQATVCYVCNTVDNQSCSFNWTAEDVRNQLYEEFIQECPKFCTQKIGIIEINNSFFFFLTWYLGIFLFSVRK